MAVMFYNEGEHPAGFIGYRVATTQGEESEFRQCYFEMRNEPEIFERVK